MIACREEGGWGVRVVVGGVLGCANRGHAADRHCNKDDTRSPMRDSQSDLGEIRWSSDKRWLRMKLVVVRDQKHMAGPSKRMLTYCARPQPFVDHCPRLRDAHHGAVWTGLRLPIRDFCMACAL